MLSKTQEEKVIQQLEFHGYITRNFCLRNYISRLSAIIQNLEKKGYRFQTGYVDTPQGKDFKYVWLKDGQANLL